MILSEEQAFTQCNNSELESAIFLDSSIAVTVLATDGDSDIQQR